MEGPEEKIPKNDQEFTKENTSKNEIEFKKFEKKIKIFKLILKFIFVAVVLFLLIFETGLTGYYFSFSEGKIIKIIY